VPTPDTAHSAPSGSLPDAHTLFDHLADAVYLIDPATSDIVWANRRAWASLGLNRDDVLDHSVLSLQKDVHGLPQWSDIADAILSTDCYRFVGRHRHREGHEVEVEVNTTHFVLAGRPYFLSVARDITRRVAHEGHSHSREKQLWFALNEAVDGLWDWEVESGRLYFSPQLKRMLGYGPDETTPALASWSGNVHPDDAPRVMASLREHMAGMRMRYEAEYRLRNRNGHYLWVHDRGRVCEYGPQGQALRLVGMMQDISDRKALEQRLHGLAAVDTLTGLASRFGGQTFLQSQAERCQRAQLPLSLAFIDVDHFKAVNDLHGHLAGDAVLTQVGQAIKSAVRASDCVCRWGGEEFLVIAPETPLAAAAGLAETLCHRVRDHLAGHDPPVTISVGVAAASEPWIDIAALLARADAALYRAKQAGRNRIETADVLSP